MSEDGGSNSDETSSQAVQLLVGEAKLEDEWEDSSVAASLSSCVLTGLQGCFCKK